jgi:hypothetical protein
VLSNGHLSFSKFGVGFIRECSERRRNFPRQDAVK